MPLFIEEPYLELQGPRPLSPLEQDAVRLVFEDSIDPCDVFLTVYEERRGNAGGYRGDGNLRLNRSAFGYADALNIDSTRANTDIFKPGNMKYLSTLIHECTHEWQSVYGRYQWRGPSEVKPALYTFTISELTELYPLKHKWEDERNPYYKKDPNNPNKKGMLNLLKEQHASAASVYFVIAWQLEYSSDRLVNLTTNSGEPNVGRVERYHEIAAIPNPNPLDPIPPDDSCAAAPPGRRVSRGCAERLSDSFVPYLVELRSGGRQRWAG